MFKKPPSPRNWKVWIVIALIIQGLLFSYFAYRHSGRGYITFSSSTIEGDMPQYIDPINNLLENGSYSPDYRMPGYGAVYLLLKILKIPYSLSVLLFLQYVVASISVYYLGLSAVLIFNKKIMFYYAYIVYITGIFTFERNNVLLTESFSASAYIFCLYFFMVYLKKDKNIHLWISGCFLCWLIFMRPVYLPTFVFFIIAILQKTKWRSSSIKYVVIFLLPFAVLDSIWTYRNYIKHNKIHPLHNGYLNVSEHNPYEPVFKILQAVGESEEYWHEETVVNFFMIENWEDKYTLPSYIETRGFNKDSLDKLAGLIQALISEKSKEKREEYSIIIDIEVAKYIESFKSENPFYYHIISPLKMLVRILTWKAAHSESHFLKHLLFHYPYYLMQFLGFIAFLLLLKKSFKDKAIMVLLGLYAYGVFIHPVVLGFSQNRYLLPIYPFVILLAAYIIHKIALRTSQIFKPFKPLSA